MVEVWLGLAFFQKFQAHMGENRTEVNTTKAREGGGGGGGVFFAFLLSEVG